MSARRVVVIGDGAAGLAAAWSASRSGATVTVVSRGAGATSFSSGAIDDEPWELVARRAKGATLAAEPLSDDLRAFLDAIAIYRAPATDYALLATMPGRVRPARGHDRALLDLARLERGVLFVADAPRPSWDARALAAAIAESRFVRSRELEIRALDAQVLREGAERKISDGDLAARHDDDERLAWLGARLRDAIANHDRVAGILVGPWLGAEAPRAEALSKLVGVPVGEALSGLGAAPGLRFEAARDRLSASLGVERIRASAKRVERGAVILDDDRALACDATVLAIGGLAGGGILYAPPDHDAGVDLPAAVHASFRLSLDAPIALGSLGVNDAVLGVGSSMHGPELDTIAWPIGDRQGALESVGVRAEDARAGDAIYAAGDVVRARPRTLIEAFRSGLRAGRAAVTS